MTDSGLYFGSLLQGVDRKGRVSIPADFRTVIECNTGSRDVVVAFHPTLPCLRVHDTKWAKDAEAAFVRRLLEGADPNVITAEREAVFGEVEKASFDPSGRFIIPDFFRQEAQITDRAFFVGAGPTFNIWAPQVLMAHDQVPDRVRRRCADQMAGKARE